MKVEFINLGRTNLNTTLEVKNERELYKEIQKHLISKRWGMDETDTPDLYEISSGFRVVGYVKILND